MTHKYMSAEPPVAFPASTPFAPTVYLNTEKTRFKIINPPSLHDLKAGIDQYAAIRSAALWREMSEIKDGRCRLFARLGNSFTNVQGAVIRELLGASTAAKVRSGDLRGTALSDAIEQLEPKCWADMDALYRINRNTECAIGRQYFLDIAATADTAFDFFGRLVDELLESTAAITPTTQMRTTFHQPRIYEFLGFAISKGWLLYPFVHKNSGMLAPK